MCERISIDRKFTHFRRSVPLMRQIAEMVEKTEGVEAEDHEFINWLKSQPGMPGLFP